MATLQTHARAMLHAESVIMTQQGGQVNPLLGLFSCFNLLQVNDTCLLASGVPLVTSCQAMHVHLFATPHYSATVAAKFIAQTAVHACLPVSM